MSSIYTLPNYVPNTLNVTIKENCQELNNLSSSVIYPVTDKNILKVQDVKNIEYRINQINHFLNILIQSNDYQFSKFHYNISGYISSLINSNWPRVTSFDTYNNQPLSCIEKIELNHDIYCYKPYNKIPYLGDYLTGDVNRVYSYNGQNGNVYGISGAYINNQLYFGPIISLTAIGTEQILKTGYVEYYNNKTGVVEYNIITGISSGYFDGSKYVSSLIVSGKYQITPIISSMYFNNSSLVSASNPQFIKNVSSHTLLQTEEYDPNIIATTQYIKNTFMNLIGVNESQIYPDKIHSRGWVQSTTEESGLGKYKQQINALSGYNLLNVYQLSNDGDWYINKPKSDYNVRLSYLESDPNFLNSITIFSDYMFNGKISYLQYIVPVEFTYSNSNGDIDPSQSWLYSIYNISNIYDFEIPNYHDYNGKRIYTTNFGIHFDDKYISKIVIPSTLNEGAQLWVHGLNCDYLDLSQSNISRCWPYTIADTPGGKATEMSDLPSTCVQAVLPGPAQYIETVKIRKNCLYCIKRSNDSFQYGSTGYIKNYVITDEVPGKYTHEFKTVTIFPNTDKEQTLTAFCADSQFTNSLITVPTNCALTSIIQGLDIPSCRFLGSDFNEKLSGHLTLIYDILSGDYHNPGFDWKWYDQQTKVYPLPDQYQNLGICSGLCMWNPTRTFSDDNRHTLGCVI